MNIKAQAIKLFLDNFRAALDQVEGETIYDRFLVDLLLEQHSKARHAFELVNWWGEQRNFDTIYENLFEQYGLVNTACSDHNINLSDFSYSSIEPLFSGFIKDRLLKYRFAVILHENELFLVNHTERTVTTINRGTKNPENYDQLIAILQNVNQYYSLADVEQCQLISSLTGLPELDSKLRAVNISELLFTLLQKEVRELDQQRQTFHFIKNQTLEVMAPLLLGTLFYAAVLAVVYLSFHVVLPITLAFAAISAGAVVLLGCATLFFYAIEKHIQHSVTQMNEHNNFTKTYDYDSASAQLKAPMVTSSLTTELSEDGKNIKISMTNSPLRFLYNRTNNGSSAIFESINNCYNTNSVECAL